jgi:hypothetical protein
MSNSSRCDLIGIILWGRGTSIESSLDIDRMRYLVPLLLLFLLLSPFDSTETSGNLVHAKKQKKKKKGKTKKTSKVQVSEEIGNDGEVLEYATDEEKQRRIAELQRNYKKKLEDKDDSGTIPPEKLAELQAKEQELNKNVYRAILKFGENSSEHATALHALGGNLYAQQKYEDVHRLAHDIVAIHESKDGKEALITAKALGNVGNVAFRLGKTRECSLVMKRALYIIIKEHGAESKEVLLHRAQMLTFGINDGETSSGLSYEDYLEELEDL